MKMSGQFHARRKYLPCPLTGRLSGPQNQNKRFEEETIFCYFRESIRTSWPSSRESSSPYRLIFSDFCGCLLINLLIQIYFLPIPKAAWSKAWVFSRLIAGIAGTNPARAWMTVCCECCVLSGRVLGYGPIPCPEESYRVCCA
jgi:hypothetical protein